MSGPGQFRVLIAGGGAAALEAAFRLQRVGGDRLETTILTPDQRFTTRAMAVLSPFAAGHALSESLDRLASDAGALLVRGRMASVAPSAHRVLTDAQETLPYDALLIAIGGVQDAPYRRAIAFGAPGAEESMHGLIQDLEGGYVRGIGFVVPPGVTWPVPLYELALMAVERAYDQCQSCTVDFVTYEDAPLGLFGPEASRLVAEKLDEAGIHLHMGVRASVPASGLIELGRGGPPLTVDRVVTLPVVRGPAVEGLPHDSRGFLRVDRHGRVDGVADVYAAGDVTHHTIKQGGLACQQADAAADAIAAQAGVAITPQAYADRLEGVLLTGRAAAFMRRDDVSPFERGWSHDASSWPPLKIAGQELIAHLAGLSRRTVVSETTDPYVRRPVARSC